MSKKAIVIDGNSLVYRMFYATYNLAEYAIQNNIFPTNAIKLMIDTIFKLKQSKQYDYCLIAFDYGKKTFRHEKYEDYKCMRKSMPNELVIQLPIIKEALGYMGFNIMSIESIEADDLIGSFSNLMTRNFVHTDIFSSDKDMLQLVNSYTSLNLLKSGISNIQIVNLSNFSDLNYGLNPSQIPDFKAIVGDSSDHLLGIKGIGLKTGIKLLIKYNSLDNIYNNLDDLSISIKQKFIESKSNAYMCKDLATINQDIFSNKSLAEFRFQDDDLDSLYSLIKKYKINGLNKYFKNLDIQLSLLG